jgi:hypothetical protein
MPSTSDWIAFLQEEISYFKEVVFFIATTVLSGVFIIATIPAAGDVIVYNAGRYILIMIFYGIFVYFFNESKKGKKPYRDLLMKIMKDELTTHEEILAEFNKIKPKKF